KLVPTSPTAGPNFEFGKRKRWADLVITELVDVLLLVLSPLGKVLYCGNGLKALLGWSDADLIDYDFADLSTISHAAEDKDGFIQAFQDSLRTGDPMAASYVRIRIAPSKSTDPASPEQLFEVNGRVQTTETDAQVFFAVAKPYPNKNVEMLDTFLELQEEHDRLQYRVAELRARAPPSSPGSPASSNASTPTSLYATTSVLPKYPIPRKPADDSDQLKKKKGNAFKRKTVPPEQYVCITCGRTDSPEWRKGPTGPKTLCNACGLRWAKQD
ncbi:hypothetical protein R3P38DRAFT_2904299, partial [Favolaschia claudopus]